MAKRVNFIRHYDLPERVLPPEIVVAEVDEGTARRQLLKQAVRHHGIGTVGRYRRLLPDEEADFGPSSGRDGRGAATVEEVEVAGWKGPVYMDPAARIPRSIDGLAVLCPFDPVIWFRPRTERLFDFHYRIEIYTPPPKRIFGYYVFPILLDGELVGRVDLKADRQAGLLRVPGSYVEEGQDPIRVADPLADEMRTMAALAGPRRRGRGEEGEPGRRRWRRRFELGAYWQRVTVSGRAAASAKERPGLGGDAVTRAA